MQLCHSRFLLSWSPWRVRGFCLETQLIKKQTSDFPVWTFRRITIFATTHYASRCSVGINASSDMSQNGSFRITDELDPSPWLKGRDSRNMGSSWEDLDLAAKAYRLSLRNINRSHICVLSSLPTNSKSRCNALLDEWQRNTSSKVLYIYYKYLILSLLIRNLHKLSKYKYISLWCPTKLLYI